MSKYTNADAAHLAVGDTFRDKGRVFTVTEVDRIGDWIRIGCERSVKGFASPSVFTFVAGQSVEMKRG